ncbi:CTR copper uptake transporter [Desarmillaria ectypa]|nr:CTR copper uptake transporter [Desarmillaria ectypa]
MLALLMLLLPVVLAHSSSGMDSMTGMDSQGSTTLMSGMMVPYLHFTTGDILLFQGWVPKSVGAMIGACIGLFMLSLIDRWLAAMRRVMEGHWAKRAQILHAKKNRDSSSEIETLKSESSALKSVVLRSAPPSVLRNDLARGAMHTLQSALSFTFMLAAMTFQVGFILAIIIGMGVGEILFGRFGTHGLGSAHVH